MILGACPHSADPQVKLCDLVSLVKAKLEQDGVIVREIRLNGSGASSVFHSLHHQHLILLGQIISVIFWSFSPRGLINADWVLSQDQQSLQSLCRFTSLSRHLLFRISLSVFFHFMRKWSFEAFFVNWIRLTMAMVAGVGLRVLRHLLQRSRPHLHSGPAHTEALRKGEWSALSGKINNSNSNFFRWSRQFWTHCWTSYLNRLQRSECLLAHWKKHMCRKWWKWTTVIDGAWLPWATTRPTLSSSSSSTGWRGSSSSPSTASTSCSTPSSSSTTVPAWTSGLKSHWN